MKIKEVFDAECLAMVDAHTQKLADAMAARNRHRGLITDECLDFCVRSTARLSILPSYYPLHLSMTDLAAGLTASVLDEGWEKTYTQQTGLYSGLSRHARTLAVEVVAQHRRSVLLGDPGQGKSTVLAAYCLAAIADGRLALFARLNDLGNIAAAGKNPGVLRIDQAAALVVDAAEASSDVVCPPEARGRLVESILNDDTLVLAFDGLDEIANQSSLAAAEKVLRALADIPGTVTIASRITGYIKPVHRATELLVDRMHESAVEDFVHSWFTENESDLRDRTLTALKDSDLSELAQIPLLAGFICYVSTYKPVETTKHGLYEQYLGLFFERRWKPTKQQRLSAKKKTRILKLATAVAWAMATQPSPNPSDPPLWADHISLRELTFDPNIRGNAAKLAETDGLLIPHGQLRQGDLLGQQYRWLHRTIHEHLAGRALANWIQRDFNGAKEFLRTAAMRRTWIVALEHCAGLLGNDPSTIKVVDYLFRLHESEDTINHTFAAALMAIIDCNGTNYRRKELAEEAFSMGEYAIALCLDKEFSERLLRERPPNILTMEPVFYDYLGKEYASSQVDVLTDAAFREPRRYSFDRTSLLRVIDEDAARRASVNDYLSRSVNQLHSALFDGLDPVQASWIIQLLPQHRSTYRLFKLVSILHIVGGELARLGLEEITSGWGVEGELVRNFYKEIERRDIDAFDDVERRALSFAFENLQQSDMGELATGSHGRFLSVLSGAHRGSRALDMGSPWFHFGTLLNELREDCTYAVPYAWNKIDAKQVDMLIAETEVVAGVDLAEEVHDERAESLLRFHAAVERATKERQTESLPTLLRILDKLCANMGYVDIPASNAYWLSEKLKRYSWEDFFESYRSSPVALTPSNIDTHFQLKNIFEYHVLGAGQDANLGCERDRLFQWLEWVVNNPGDPSLIDFVQAHGLIPINYAEDIINVVHAGRNEENRRRILSRVERWIASEDQLPRYQRILSSIRTNRASTTA